MFSGILSKVLIRGNRLQLPIRNVPQRLCSNVASSEIVGHTKKFHSALEGVSSSIVSNPQFAELPDIAARVTENYEFAALAMETLGPWSADMRTFIQDMSTRLILASGDQRAGSYFSQKISLLVQRGNAASVLGTMPQAQILDGLLDYQLIGGKCLRGLLTVMAYEAWEKPNNITEESLKLSYIMGWCVEIFNAYWLMLDDIVDASEKRRNKLCWYRLPNVGMQAINDSALLYSSMLDLLKKNFGNIPGYMQIKDLFNKAFLYTSIGQHIDFSLSQRKHGFSMFTEENYNKMSKYKTTYYSFVLPMSLGMVLANKYDEENVKKVHKIIEKLGRLYQIQNDIRDVYGLESGIGNNGNDIVQGKCTWLAFKTLQLCSDDERKIFTTYYGSHEPAHVHQIKALYDQLDLPTKYEEEERIIRNEIVHHANNFGDSRVSGLFLRLLDTVFNRK